VTWDFRAAVGATALTWLIIAAPEAMPPVTDQDYSKQANDTARSSGKMAIAILADAVYSGEIQ
jgi:hypothetical protein